jgi:hypothetical protein
MNRKTEITADLMAPCGMNCGICMAYLRDKKKCPGCREPDTNKSVSCARCKIKNCKFFKKNVAKFCFECGKYPCDKVKHIDKRYRGKYGMSMIENLNKIKQIGLEKFMEIENSRWVCPVCGNPICVHNKKCYFCEKNNA